MTVRFISFDPSWPGAVPAIHAVPPVICFTPGDRRMGVDTRHKAGHDERDRRWGE